MVYPYPRAVSTSHASSYRRYKVLVVTFVLVCSVYWFCARTRSQSLGFGSLNKNIIAATSSGSRNLASPKWSSSEYGNGRFRLMDAAAKVPAPSPPPARAEFTTTLVVASTSEDNTTWLYNSFSDWQKSVYVVDDSQANLTVPVNKGRESMVYLTYGYSLPGICAVNSLRLIILAISSTTTTICQTICFLYTRKDISGITTTPTTTGYP